jgi:hypothetical protein
VSANSRRKFFSEQAPVRECGQNIEVGELLEMPPAIFQFGNPICDLLLEFVLVPSQKRRPDLIVGSTHLSDEPQQARSPQTGLVNSADGSKAKRCGETLETDYRNGHASGGLTSLAREFHRGADLT